MQKGITFTLWCAVSGEFDSDWHRTEAAADAHKIRCGLRDDWRVVALTGEQVSEVYAVRS
jgi:hypothetical protein